MLRTLRKRTPAPAAALLTAAGVTAAGTQDACAATSVTVDGSVTYQPIDGFGSCEHFGRAAIMNGSQGLSARHQKELLDLLFSRSTGAGLSIRRGELRERRPAPGVRGLPRAVREVLPPGSRRSSARSPGRRAYRVSCCDSFGWDQQKASSAAIEADATARRLVTTLTAHTYASAVDGPLPTRHRTWMSEWSPDGTAWNENGDDGSGYGGITVAAAIHDALTKGDGSGYVYWYGASTGATRGLIQMDGDGHHVSPRLWAMANYSRFLRPGALRTAATTSDPALKLRRRPRCPAPCATRASRREPRPPT
ncbi:glycoside hydrolase [Streptomyces sp. 7R007]